MSATAGTSTSNSVPQPPITIRSSNSHRHARKPAVMVGNTSSAMLLQRVLNWDFCAVRALVPGWRRRPLGGRLGADWFAEEAPTMRELPTLALLAWCLGLPPAGLRLWSGPSCLRQWYVITVSRTPDLFRSPGGSGEPGNLRPARPRAERKRPARVWIVRRSSDEEGGNDYAPCFCMTVGRFADFNAVGKTLTEIATLLGARG
jgi:hypothetical protein